MLPPLKLPKTQKGKMREGLAKKNCSSIDSLRSRQYIMLGKGWGMRGRKCADICWYWVLTKKHIHNLKVESYVLCGRNF